MTLAYKFLGAGEVGVLSGFAWPVGDWVEVTGPLIPSQRGVHACLTTHMPYWVDEELWRIELGGDVLETERMLVASRGRLVERVDAWDADAIQAFVAACVDRVRGVRGWEDDARFWAGQRGGAGTVSYIAANAAGIVAADWIQGFAAERRWQAGWLAKRLGLGILPEDQAALRRPAVGVAIDPPTAPAAPDPQGGSAPQKFVFLTTKLHPPTLRAEIVPRRRLVQRLTAHGPERVTLLVAPPGWGKTTLLGEWRASTEEARPFAWVSCDQDDNDPVRFWSYLVQALRSMTPRISTEQLTLLRTPRVSIGDDVLPGLVNGLARMEYPIVLALDDYHTITNAEIHRQVEFLIGHLPAGVHVVLASRSEPPLPLARMRVRQELREIKADELRFSGSETEELLNGALGLDLKPELVAALRERTEGWAAGLHLAALSVRGQPEREAFSIEFATEFAGDDRYLEDYLLTEVLDRQPDHVRHFLLRTAMLDRLCGPLCDAVTGQTGSAQTLVEIERANLFLVPLDTRREWYRYHQLFSQLLRRELERGEPEVVKTIHRRAAAWFGDHGHISEAIAHATAAGDLDGAAALIARYWNTFARHGLHETVGAWLDALPTEVVTGDARLCLAHAWTALGFRRVSEAASWIEAAEHAPHAHPPEGTASVESGIAHARAVQLCMLGEFRAAEECAARALALEGPATYWRSLASTVLGQCRHWRGRTREAVAALEEAVDLARAGRHPQTRVSALGHLAAIQAEGGDLISAGELADEARRLAEEHAGGEHWASGLALIVSGQVLAHQNRLDDAATAIERGIVLARRGASFDVAYGLVALARVRHAQGERIAARNLLEEARRLGDACPEPGILSGLISDAIPPARGARKTDAPALVEELTNREAAVLRLLPTGLTLREIAATLYVSRNTVKTQAASVYRKLGVSSRVEAVSRARDLALM